MSLNSNPSGTGPSDYTQFHDVIRSCVSSTQRPNGLHSHNRASSRRNREVTHVRTHIRYSHKKFWYIGLMIRGMSVDEALKQLSFYNKKGALIVKEILEEAIDLAVTEHNVEYRSNLWVCDAYACRVGGRGYGYFRRMGGRIDIIRHSFSNFYVRLREGRPPKMIYSKERDGHEQLEEYVDNIRKRRIYKSL